MENYQEYPKATLESVWAAFRETDRQMKESYENFDRRMKKFNVLKHFFDVCFLRQRFTLNTQCSALSLYGLLILFVFSCASTRRSVPADLVNVADVTGVYYGSGKLWNPGDVKDAVITLTRDNDNTLIANVEATLPVELRQIGGRQYFSGNLTVAPDYGLNGSLKLFIIKFNVTESSVDPTNHTIILNFSATIMGHTLNFELTGGPEKPDQTYLFNGRDLTGWVKRGGDAEFTVENGEIIGSAKAGSSSTFLCSEQEYGDFILEYEIMVDTALNSGMQIRSHVRTDVKDGIEYDRIYGYQVEVDPSERGWSAGIYDEARNGWLYPVTPHNPTAVSSFKNHEWNRFRVEAIGNNIKTWLNGVPVADLLVDLDDSGFLGLQVHSINITNSPWAEGATVRMRNIRIITENLETNRKTDTQPIHQVNVINP